MNCMLRKTIAIIASITLLTACSGTQTGNTATESTAAEQTAADTAVSQTDAGTTAATEDNSPSEPVDLEKGLTDKMYNRALLNEGNRARLANAMKKAKNGEAVTVGVIGGSITQGTAASNPSLCYGGLFNKWWTEKFPDTPVNYVNAGIGGTNSYLGVHRVDAQLLSEKPDVVIVEFSVNDTDRLMNKYSYDSLVRKIMNSESAPAVILLFTTQENGTSLQDTHLEIGLSYDLPCLSYREAVYPEVAAGTLNWKDISPDNIHPNDTGHSLIGQILSRYLDSVYDDMDALAEGDTSFDAPAFTADYYPDAHILSANEIDPLEISGFTMGTNKVYPVLYPDNFVTEDEGYLKFEEDFACLGIFYLKTTDGKGGKYDVLVDGERKGIIDADFSGGWGNVGEPGQIVMGKENAHHTVEIKLSEGSDKTALTILGIMIS